MTDTLRQDKFDQLIRNCYLSLAFTKPFPRFLLRNRFLSRKLSQQLSRRFGFGVGRLLAAFPDGLDRVASTISSGRSKLVVTIRKKRSFSKLEFDPSSIKVIFLLPSVIVLAGCANATKTNTNREGVQIGQTCQSSNGVSRNEKLTEIEYSPRFLAGFGKSDLRIFFVSDENLLLIENTLKQCFTEIKFGSKIEAIRTPASRFVDNRNGPFSNQIGISLDRMYEECERQQAKKTASPIAPLSSLEKRSDCSTSVSKSLAFFEVDTTTSKFTIYNDHFNTFVW